ncbi:hypothetical protein DFH09DRAFT_1390400 [Mycena vulgaris]|nr:hypothetical protein DFH09DRAFT_1390400 [Mycena vulgaris]
MSLQSPGRPLEGYVTVPAITLWRYFTPLRFVLGCKWGQKGMYSLGGHGVTVHEDYILRIYSTHFEASLSHTHLKKRSTSSGSRLLLGFLCAGVLGGGGLLLGGVGVRGEEERRDERADSRHFGWVGVFVRWSWCDGVGVGVTHGDPGDTGGRGQTRRTA